MRFEWDRAKSARNLVERGFDFEFASRVFEGWTLERIDDRRDYGERRTVAVGVVEGVAVTVVYTERGTAGGRTRRIVSARPGNRRERAAYEQAIATK